MNVMSLTVQVRMKLKTALH